MNGEGGVCDGDLDGEDDEENENEFPAADSIQHNTGARPPAGMVGTTGIVGAAGNGAGRNENLF